MFLTPTRSLKRKYVGLGSALGGITSSDPLQGALVGGLSAGLSECVSEGIFGDAEDRLLEYREEGMSYEEAQDRLLDDIQFAGNVGRLASVVTAFLAGEDVELAARTAENAVTNNFEPTTTALILTTAAVALTIWEAMDIYETYQIDGPEAALIKAGVAAGTAAIGGQIAKRGFKIAGKLYLIAEEAWTAYMAQSPTLQRAAHKISQRIAELGEKFSETGLYKYYQNIGPAIGETITNTTNRVLDNAKSLLKRGKGKEPKIELVSSGEKVVKPKVPGKKISELSDEEFISDIARRADRKFDGNGPQVGTKKHQYAKRLVEEVQRRRGEKIDLQLERRYKGGEEYRPGMGTKDSVIPDVYNPETGWAYDYKFGQAKVTNRQRSNLLYALRF